ncbi:hypothetical protein JHU04_004313 [Brenneria sp. 4F2]|nr:hypothetical protein [Brenneria bubanii]
MNSGVINAQDNNRVYIEPDKNKPSTPKNVEYKYQIKPKKGRDHIEKDVPNYLSPRYHRGELTIKGDIELNNHQVFKRK